MSIFRPAAWQQQHQRGFWPFLLLMAALLVFWEIVVLVADWLWFQEVGYTSVFFVTLTARFGAGFVFGVLFFLVAYGNLFAALRASASADIPSLENVVHFPTAKISDEGLRRIAPGVCFILSFFAALRGAAQGENVLRFLNGTPFGLKDPLFQRDIGFYVFQLPFLHYIYSWLMEVLVFTLALTAGIYLLRRAFLLIPPRTIRVSPAARNHLMILLAAVFFLMAFGFWIDLNELLFVKRGVVFGPGYTDATTQVWVLRLLIGLGILTGASFLFYLFRPLWRLPALAVLVFIAAFLVGRSFYPAFVQKFRVVPNEVVLEKPYLERNIAYTRLAYGLENVEAREFSADERLTLADIRRNEPTVRNIRLWDHAPLLQTYGQTQEIRTYYKFLNVDNDRYTVGDEYRQVMISPRELSYPSLPSRTWVNEHLTYTHGFGAVMGPVNRISPEGLPEFFIKDIPPVSTTSVKVTRPEVYFGEAANEYIFVKTKRPEFDYPVGDENVYTRYEGKGGVPLSAWKKVLFALRFQSLTILLSNDIAAGSRIMYHRNVRERVAKIAPFLVLDDDPYLVVSAEGRLLWFVDAYTVTDRFPYSEPTQKLGNYIRNSAKAVVDAYDGTVALYVSDPADPLIRTYAKIFPGAFKPLEEMPEGLRRHVRYPPGMLSVQARMYRTYHMQDPQVFYNKEDLWTIPATNTQDGEKEMEPYYTIMQLPDGEKEEFILLLPFTPARKDNMAAWMAARCDAPNYGKILVYKFPKQRLVYGPRQIEARINQDAYISQQLSLWNQRGSQSIRGSLLAIPLEQSILYVQPLYLSAETGQLPELKRVIVAFGNTIVMEENLEQSLGRIFGTGAGAATVEKATAAEGPQAAAAAATPGAGALAQEALAHYRKAQEHLRQGNWSGFGEELRLLGTALETMARRANAAR